MHRTLTEVQSVLLAKSAESPATPQGKGLAAFSPFLGEAGAVPERSSEVGTYLQKNS